MYFGKDKQVISLLNKNDYLLISNKKSDVLDIFKENKPDLVIIDLEDSQKEIDTLKKALTVSDLTPIVVITPERDHNAIINIFRLGAWDILEKSKLSEKTLMDLVQFSLKRAEEKKIHRETGIMLRQLIDENISGLKKQKDQLQLEIEERKKLEKIILQAKREWEQIIDSIPDCVFLLDREYNIIKLNKTMAKAFNLHPRNIVGKKCYEVVHGSKKIPEFCPHKHLLKKKHPITIEAYEKQLGGDIEITATPYLDPDGTIIGSVYIVRNISNRKKAEKERELLNLQLLQAQKLEAVGQLAAGIAHEINTPIQYVGSNLDFFKEAFEDISILVVELNRFLKIAKEKRLSDTDIKELESLFEEIDWEYLEEEVPSALEQAKEGVNRVTKIVRAMKEFSHPGVKEKKPHNINSIIETTVTISKNEWKYVSDLKLDLDNDLPEIPCLKDELGQVFLNMIVNSAHAISEKVEKDPSFEKGLIAITTAHNDDRVVITIKDNGNGIPERIKNKIFEPFFTTKDTGKGTGQGLAISRDVIVKKHNGDITVDSIVGEGTKFTISLPVR